MIVVGLNHYACNSLDYRFWQSGISAGVRVDHPALRAPLLGRRGVDVIVLGFNPLSCSESPPAKGEYPKGEGVFFLHLQYIVVLSGKLRRSLDLTAAWGMKGGKV